MTGSVFIGLLFKFLNTLNGYYEHSVAHRAVKHLFRLFEGSLVYRGGRKLFANDEGRYSGGSIILRLIYRLTDGFVLLCSKICGLLQKLGGGSLPIGMTVSVLPRLGTALGGLADGSLFKQLTLFVIAGEDKKTQSLYKFLTLEIPLAAFLFVACLVPHQYWSNTYILVAAVLLSGLYLLRAALGKNQVGLVKSLPPVFLVYAGLSCASLFISFNFGDSLRIFLIFISCLIICALIQGAITSKALFESFISIIFFAMVLSSLFGIYQYHSGIEVRADLVDLVASAGLMRLFSTMDNPNNYAEFLVLMLPLCVAHVLTRKTDLEKLFYTLLLMPCVLALVLTYSRAALLVAVAAFGIFVMIINPRLTPLFLVGFILCLPFIPDSVTNRIMTIGRDTSSTYRLTIWQGALNVLKDNWLVGVGMGPGAFAYVYKPLANPLAMTAMHSHNLLLQIWIETGLFSFVSFIALMFSTFKNCFLRSFNAVGGYKYYLAAAAATIPAIIAFSMVEYVWFYPRVMLMFWVFIGLAIKAVNLQRLEKAE